MPQKQITNEQLESIAASKVTGTLAVANGGTGTTSLAANNVLLGNGTGSVQVVAPGTSGNVLTSNGTTWTSAPSAGGSSSNTYKEAVRVATTANITLSGNVTVDGVTTAPGDRVLVKNQSTASQNGIYVSAAGAWSRATDFDTTGTEVANGAIIPVQFGTINGGSTWQLVQNGGTIGNSFRFAPVGGLLSAGLSALNTPVVGASASNAIALGSGSTANSAGTIVIGGSAAVSGTFTTGAVVIGASASASGTTSTAHTVVGNLATASNGDGHTALGGSATASASTSLAFIGALALGSASVADGEGSVALGAQTGTGSRLGVVAIGAFGNPAFNSGIWVSTGRFAAQADMQMALTQLWTTTTSATPVEMGNTMLAFSGGNATAPTNRIILTNDSSYVFTLDIVARNTATDTESKAWNLRFAIRRGTNAASTALIGTATKTVIGEDTGTSAWDVSVTADTTNGRPNISVTGEAAKTIRWVASVRMTKVSG